MRHSIFWRQADKFFSQKFLGGGNSPSFGNWEKACVDFRRGKMDVLRPVSAYKVMYKATHSQTGLIIQGCVYYPPDFLKGPNELFTEVGDGLYFLEVDFSVEGTYAVNIGGKFQVYRVFDIARESRDAKDLMMATVVFDKANNELSFYRNPDRTGLLARFKVRDLELETAKERL